MNLNDFQLHKNCLLFAHPQFRSNHSLSGSICFNCLNIKLILQARIVMAGWVSGLTMNADVDPSEYSSINISTTSTNCRWWTHLTRQQ